MAKISVKGNIGKVETGHQPNSSYIAFSVAENHGYRDKQTGKWVNKGTLWHECTYWIYNDNDHKKFNHLTQLLTVGTPVVVIGRLTINPGEKVDEKTGEITHYQNPYINVEDVGITLNRIERIQYKPKQEISGATDPEFQQYAQAQAPVQGQTAPNTAPPQTAPIQRQQPSSQVNQGQAPTQLSQPPLATQQGAQTAQPAQSPQSQTTPLDEPFPGVGDEDVNF